MKQIILMRHALDMASAQKIKKTSRDNPSLSELGKKQAQATKKFLDKYSYEAIFTSSYKRTQETAKLINTKNAPISSSNAFNDYHVQPNGKETETVAMGIARVMPKIYSMFDKYDSVLIVTHNNIPKTILQVILNLEYEKANSYFNEFGETHVLRYNWKAGDKTWRIIDSFKP